MRLFILTLALIALSGCSDNKNFSESGTDFVQLASLEVSRNGVPVDSLNLFDFTGGGDVATVSLAVQATLLAPVAASGNPVQSSASTAQAPEVLSVLLLAPDGTDAASSGLQLQGNGINYEGTLNFSIDKNQVGNYTVAVAASPSSNARRKLRLYRPNVAPQLLTVNSPDTVRLSPTDFTIFKVTAQATDADGASDLAFIEAVNPATGTQRRLLDDGGIASGDAFTGDGVFTITFSVPPNSTGTVTFNYRAIDRTGDGSSPVISKSIVFIQ